MSEHADVIRGALTTLPVGRAIAALAALDALEAERDEARYSPLGDNHHNAAACPYCGDLLGKAKADLARKDEALREFIEGVETSGILPRRHHARFAALKAALEQA